jgi:PAS domain S-box-containing protein
LNKVPFSKYKFGFDRSVEKQEMLAAIIEGSEDAIISKDLTSRITSWNKAAERMFGYTENEMMGKYIHLLIPQDRIGEEDEIINKLKSGERIEHFETIRVTKAGRELILSLTISPIRNSDGVVVGASKIARDITRQKQNEQRLTVLNELAKTINAKLEINRILQVVTDASTQAANAAFGAFFYNKVDVSGETYMLYALSGAERSDFEKFGMPRNTLIFKTTFEGKGIVRSNDITKDPRYGQNPPHHGMPKGHLPVVSYLAVPVVSPTGTVVGGLFFGHPKPGIFTEDHENVVMAIAAQAAIALDNAKLLQELNAIGEKKDQFIGFASHELKTPLTTLKGYLDMALNGTIPTAAALPKLKKQVERLEGIIYDLLDISRIQAGKLDLNVEKKCLQDLINESVEVIDLRKHHLVSKLPEEKIDVEIDPNKMGQVIINLLSNAVKYSNSGSVIEISSFLMGADVHITVKDEGIGIDQKDLHKIFNEYYRVPTNRAEGAGLGLFISKEIVGAHAGKLWAESEPGKGSTFHVVFPINHRN